jgi:hypothetical protein
VEKYRNPRATEGESIFNSLSPKTKRKIIERGKIDTSNTQIHDRSFSVFGPGTSMKSGRVKIVVWVQISSVSEMIRSCRCIPHVSKKQLKKEDNPDFF